jgi:archaellum component FlaC
MRRVSRIGLQALLALGMILPGTVQAESLAELAAREKARRARSDATKVKAITSEDLEAVAREQGKSAEPASSDTTTGDSTDRGEQLAASDDLAQYDAKFERWKGDVASAKEAVAAQETKIKDLETEIAQLRADLNPTHMTAVNREATVNQEITDRLAKIEAAKSDLEAAKQKVEDVLEAARKDGIPISQLD